MLMTNRSMIGLSRREKKIRNHFVINDFAATVRERISAPSACNENTISGPTRFIFLRCVVVFASATVWVFSLHTSLAAKIMKAFSESSLRNAIMYSAS